MGVPPNYKRNQAKRNLQSAYDHPDVVQDYLDREERLGRIQCLPADGVNSLLPFGCQISPFGVIPKRNSPGKWRLIVNLSAHSGCSTNDATDQELSSISYTSIDDAAKLIQLLGPGCQLAKLDLKEAYRSVPVHPADQLKLAVKWKDSAYIDRALLFGLRSAPKIFSAIADSVMWMLHAAGVRWGLHYLDDFLLLGPPATPDCQTALHSTLTICDDLGLMVAP